MHSASQDETPSAGQPELLFGHPVGLFTLFFAEMWERFSYYGMRSLLTLYMLKGFLKYGDDHSYAVYGAYTALVYMTPFFGGMLADRLLGARRAVVLGGLLMSAGHLLMTVEHHLAFFAALALLIVGNGFFKPNISTMVGTLYSKENPRRDAGFTIFYIGINLGAALAPLLCYYIGDHYGWHWGFGLATIGMMTGLAVFVAPPRITQFVILIGALATGAALLYFHPEKRFEMAINVFVAAALLTSAGVVWVALGRGGLPAWAGAPPDRSKLRRSVVPGLNAEWTVYGASLVAVLVFTSLVSGFAPWRADKKPLTFFAETIKEYETREDSAATRVTGVVLKQVSTPAGMVLAILGVGAYVYLGIETLRLDKIARERMFVVIILTFFSMLFWAFFEQAGSSLNVFTDRNVDRVSEQNHVTADEVGKTIRIQPTQEQLGYYNGEQLFTLDLLDKLRTDHTNDPNFEIDWHVTGQDVGMGIATRDEETPTGFYQAINPVNIMILGLVITALWSFLGARGWEPSTAFKFALGLLQLGLGFVAVWFGAVSCDERGMVGVVWLLLAYLLHTTGELCLSPVGLSMVTKLSPARFVSTVMGSWFLATAFAQFLAAIIAQFTAVKTDASGAVPVPAETVNVYGSVWGGIGVAAIISAAICFLLVPVLKKWMHEGED